MLLDHHNISDSVQLNLVSQVMPSHSIKSPDVFPPLNAFPSPIIHIKVFSHKLKTTSSDRKNFFMF